MAQILRYTNLVPGSFPPFAVKFQRDNILQNIVRRQKPSHRDHKKKRTIHVVRLRKTKLFVKYVTRYKTRYFMK